MIKLNYDSEGKILGAYDSVIDCPSPFILVEDQAWSDAQAPFMVPSVDLNTLQLVVTEVHDPLKEFDVIKFQTDLATAAVSGQFTGMADPVIEFAPLNTYATNLDFTGMAQYLSWRLAMGKVQQADIDIVKKILLTQGIVI